VAAELVIFVGLPASGKNQEGLDEIHDVRLAEGGGFNVVERAR
jgi:hypothetical protein